MPNQNENNNLRNALIIAAVISGVALIGAILLQNHLNNSEAVIELPDEFEEFQGNNRSDSDRRLVVGLSPFPCGNFVPPAEGNCVPPIGFVETGEECIFCTIRFDGCEPISVLQCNHRFHRRCLQYSMHCSDGNRNQCPLCRAAIQFKNE